MQKIKIKAEELEMRFAGSEGNRQVLTGVNLTVYEGELLCLLGPSGSGKTTLLNIMAGFAKETGGRLAVNGKTVNGPDAGCIMLFQNYGLFPWRSVLGNVEYGLEVKGAPVAQRRAKAEEMLRLVGLEQFARYHPHQLSSGMQQRAAIARALAVDPGILFMDEPFGALDAVTRLKMQEELIRIWQEKKSTIVFVTHEISEAVFLADRIAIMSSASGRIEHVQKVLLARPRRRDSADFIRFHDFITAQFTASVREALEYNI